MNVFELLAQQVNDRFAPAGYPPPRWEVVGSKAVLNWDQFFRTSLAPNSEHPGAHTLVVTLPPPLLPLIEALHAEGWKRGGWYEEFHLWRLYAYLRVGEVEVRVNGSVAQADHPDRNTMSAFWSPPPPELSRRKGFAEEYFEWQRKGREDEW